MKDLVVFHNEMLPDGKPVNIKSFATKGKLIDRVKALVEANPERLQQLKHEETLFFQAVIDKAYYEHIEQRLNATEDEPATPEMPKKAIKKAKESNDKTLAKPEPKGPTI